MRGCSPSWPLTFTQHSATDITSRSQLVHCSLLPSFVPSYFLLATPAFRLYHWRLSLLCLYCSDLLIQGAPYLASTLLPACELQGVLFYFVLFCSSQTTLATLVHLSSSTQDSQLISTESTLDVIFQN